jgi:dihydroxyacetone kinase-like predicted kinase
VSAQADLELVRGLVGAALASLETSRSRIDDLNVYPVPDGDTGTNLTLTVRAVVDGLASAEPCERPGLAHAVARAALMGARGNSGVILSQIVRGVADVLARSTNGIDPALTSRALRGASDAAYRAVRRPVEGTMLSVIRELAEEAERRTAEPESVGELLVGLVRHGDDAVARTPEQLEVLREAGVADAGGAGLVELLRGLAGALSGESLPAAPPAEAPSGVEAANMHDQQERRELRLAASPAEPATPSNSVGLSLVPSSRSKSGVVAVVAGKGNRLLFETLAEPVGTVRVVAGGQTATPSTAELVAAIEEVNADEAIVLPNNPNVRLAAEHAVEQAGLPAEVVSTRSIPAGLAALVAYDGRRGAAENAADMAAAAAAVATGEVTRASHAVELAGLAIRGGDWLGLADGEPVAGGDDFAEVAFEVHEGGQPHYPLLLGAE